MEAKTRKKNQSAECFLFSLLSREATMSESSLHTKEHYNYPRKMRTPTHPVEGDFLSLSTEEALFGLLFAWMAFWAFKQLRAMLAYYKELKTLAGDTGEVGVTVGDGDAIAEGGLDDEEEDDEIELEEEEDYAFVKRAQVANNHGEQKKKD